MSLAAYLVYKKIKAMKEAQQPIQFSFGTKLKGSRLKLGLTTRQLGAKAGLSHQVISKYEKNDSVPKQKNIDKLIAGLEVELDYFSKVNEVVIEYYQASKEVDIAIVEKIEQSLTNFINLEQLVDKEYMPRFTKNQFTLENIGDARKAAQQMRFLGNQRLYAIRNIFPFAEQLGVKLVEEKMPDAIKSLSGFYNEKGCFIALNMHLDMEERRMQIVKGLFNLFCQIPPDDLKLQQSLFESFISELLLPTSTIKHNLGIDRTNILLWEISNLAQNYMIPMELVIGQIIHLGLIQPEYLPAFKEKMEANYFGIKHHVIFYFENHFRIINLMLRAKAEGIFQEAEEANRFTYLYNKEAIIV